MSNATVVVGCKLPAGIIMQVGERKHRINGWNQNTIVGASHGITEDVPEDLFNEWMKQNAESKLVKNGFIFSGKTAKSVESQAAEKRTEKTGQEQLAQPKKNDKPGALGAADKD